MAVRAILGLFRDPDSAAEAVSSLKGSGFPGQDLDVLTGSPYPEGAFGEHDPGHKVFVFPLIGAAIGFSIGLLLTTGTQLSYPMVTGGKPIISVPPMLIIMYEGTMLGAIIFTILGVLFESRLPRIGVAPYDPRITEGYIGVQVACPEERVFAAEGVLRQVGAVDIVYDNRGRPG